MSLSFMRSRRGSVPPGFGVGGDQIGEKDFWWSGAEEECLVDLGFATVGRHQRSFTIRII